jgi:predicted kinase
MIHNEAWLILIIGLPGTGKTTLANKLSEVFGCPVITTESIRSFLYEEKKVTEDRDFTSDELNLTYRVVDLIADFLLSSKASIIVDGVFRHQKQREGIIELSKRHNARFLGIHTYCSDQIALERLRKRKAQSTNSPAGEITYQNVKSEFEPVDRNFVNVNTD